MFLEGFGPQILLGTLATIKLALCSLLIAVLAGLMGASSKLSSNCLLRTLATAYTTVNHVMFLHQGRVEESGAPGTLLEQPQSERLQQFLAGSLK